MRVAIASGKGGTGKTLVSTSLAWLLAKGQHRVTYVDADVEEPNGHLFLHPEVNKIQEFSRSVPALKNGSCTGCGECQRFCHFNAIIALENDVLVFPELCSSCGGCVLVCADKALEEIPRDIGIIQQGSVIKNGINPMGFLSATLNIGEARATPLIKGVLDRTGNEGIILIDSPPGTSCNVMEIVRTVDLVILVTEPTPFGLHDLKLAVEMVKVFGKATMVVINRSDLGDDATKKYLTQEGIETVVEIPFHPEIARVYSEGEIAAACIPEFHNLLLPLGERLLERVTL